MNTLLGFNLFVTGFTPGAESGSFARVYPVIRALTCLGAARQTGETP